MGTWAQSVEIIYAAPDYRFFLASLTLFPPSESCTNPDCIQHASILKKEQQCAVVVYTAEHGVQLAWSIHLLCHGMCVLPICLILA
jgi:hypothetical protein